MKKSLVIICCLILVLSMTLVSAGWFSDWWGKITGKVVDTTLRVAFYQGKINQHTENGVWKSDTDPSKPGAELGATESGRITYCKKFYGDGITGAPEYQIETITGWCDANYVCTYTSTRQTYECVSSGTAPVCGDGTCDWNEDCLNCDVDCGVCETPSTCTDSDANTNYPDGLNYYTKGWYSGYGDFCSLNAGEENILLEYYCTYDSSGNPIKSYTTYNCASEGKVCKEGACTAGTLGWTEWLDRDNPSGSGDWEDLALHRITHPDICESPADIECRTVDGKIDYSETGEVVTCDPKIGLVCKNVDNLEKGTVFFSEDYVFEFLDDASLSLNSIKINNENYGVNTASCGIDILGCKNYIFLGEISGTITVFNSEGKNYIFIRLYFSQDYSPSEPIGQLNFKLIMEEE